MATILIVDDSPSQIAHFTKILEKAGYEHLIAEDGASGVALAKSAKPDLVLMDVVMPELNGFQATRKLTQDPETKDIPVIMVTTKDQETDRVWGQRQGAKGFMVKPVEEDELLAEIRKFI
jgi:twitching motility two-component system response regulator PilH